MSVGIVDGLAAQVLYPGIDNACILPALTLVVASIRVCGA